MNNNCPYCGAAIRVGARANGRAATIRRLVEVVEAKTDTLRQYADTFYGVVAENMMLKQRLTAAEALIAKLPHTVDRVPVVPGMVVHVRCGHKRIPIVAWDLHLRTFLDDPIIWEVRYDECYETMTITLTNCYSTREAAEKAKGNCQSTQTISPKGTS